jgi:hypothetical protein
MVEIKIDTDKASKHDIKRSIEFLKKYLEENVSNEFESDVSFGSMNMFNQDEKSSLKKQDLKKEDPDPDLEIKPIFY